MLGLYCKQQELNSHSQVVNLQKELPSITATYGTCFQEHPAAGGQMEVPAGGAGSDLQEHPGPGAAPLPHLQGSPQLPANDMLFWPGTAACDVCPQQRDTGGEEGRFMLENGKYLGVRGGSERKSSEAADLLKTSSSYSGKAWLSDCKAKQTYD